MQENIVNVTNNMKDTSHCSAFMWVIVYRIYDDVMKLYYSEGNEIVWECSDNNNTEGMKKSEARIGIEIGGCSCGVENVKCY